MSSSDQQTINFDQKVMTERKKQTYFQLVPPEDQDDQDNNSGPILKSVEQYQPEKGQKRLTDFPLKKQLQPLKKPDLEGSDFKKDDEYKVVVKNYSQQKQNQCNQGVNFYKNNDIYGVEDQIYQQSLNASERQRSNKDFEFKRSQIQDYSSVQKNRPVVVLSSRTTSKIVDIVQIEMAILSGDSNQIPENKFGGNHRLLNKNLRISPTQNKKQISQGDGGTKKASQIRSDQVTCGINDIPAEEKKQQTELKEKDKHEVTFFYNEEGNLIYTEECYKEPMSKANIKAYIEPIEKPEKMEVDEDYLRPQDKENLLEGVPEALKKTMSGSKTIVYREESHLQEILDYMGMEEKKKQKKSEPEKSKKFQEKDVQIDGSIEKMKQSEKKPIRHVKIQDMLPNSIADEQIEMQSIPSLVGRPLPINPSEDRAQKLIIPQSKRQTKKKEFTKGNTSKNLRTPLKKEEDEDVSNRQKIPPGSLYHFEIIPNRASHRKNIVQVRRSSRIYSKSKSKYQYEEEQKLSKIEESESENFSNTITMRRREKSDEKNEKSKKFQKPKTNTKLKTNAKSNSKKKPQNESEDKQITIEWLKEHIGDLSEIVVHHAYMEQDFFAMTQKDEAICRFLQDLQNAKELIECGEPETKQEFSTVRENQLIRRDSQKIEKKEKSSKKNNKPTKSKAKSKTLKQKQKFKPNIKIQKTVEITFKNKQSQNIPQNNQDFTDFYQRPIVDVHIHGPNAQSIQDSRQIEDSRPQRELTETEKKRIFKQNMEKYRVPEELPITVQEIVNPDILGLGVYALVRLGRLSEFQFGTRYAITPLCMIRYARKKHVLLALEESKKLVPPEYADNIALIALNTMLIELIEKAKEETSGKWEEGEKNPKRGLESEKN